LSRAIPALLNLATVWVLISSLTAREYGYFGVAQAAVNAIAMIACGWFTQGSLRFSGIIHDPVNRPTVRAGAGLAVLAGASLTALGVATLGVPWATVQGGVAATGLAMALIAHAIASALMQARLAAKSVMVLETLRASVALGLAIIFLVVLDGGALLAVGTIAGSYVSSAIYGYISDFRTAHSQPTGYARLLLTDLVRFGAPMSIWFALSLSHPVVERAIVQTILGIEAAGLYSATYDLAFRSASVLLMPVVLALHPRIVQRHDARTPITALLGLGYAICIPTSVLIVLASWRFGLDILRTTGAGSQGSAEAFATLAASGCLWGLSHLAHKRLEVANRTGLMCASLAAALCADVASSLLLIPRFGIIGASLSSLASSLAYLTTVTALGALVRSKVRADDVT
jgi:O-antigen/teichoic acid export membrane protein